MTPPKDSPALPPYAYGGARQMVRLHEHHLRIFLDTWRQAKEVGLPLPETTDRAYVSLDTLLYHVLGAARGYMVWMCEVLKLPDPDIRPAPQADAIAAEASNFLEHVVEGWRTPLAEVPEKRFNEVYPSRWKVGYCIDAMMEHAVMHPIRHTFQLQDLLAAHRAK